MNSIVWVVAQPVEGRIKSQFLKRHSVPENSNKTTLYLNVLTVFGETNNFTFSVRTDTFTFNVHVHSFSCCAIKTERSVD